MGKVRLGREGWRGCFCFGFKLLNLFPEILDFQRDVNRALWAKARRLLL
ncbi:MAG: hypothetical protein ACE5NP_05910 [Anaerolineae bacterium]